MPIRPSHPARRIACLLALAAASLAHGAPAPHPGTQPSPREERPMVAIYEFRSGVSEIGARAATDMFVTALVRSGYFRVMERARLNEGVLREKQLGGGSTGDAAGAPLHGVRYLFEGTLSEANASEDQRASGVSLGGLDIGEGRNRDAIAIDVRVVDASTGEIVDVITVRRTVEATQSGVSGIGNLVSAVAAMHGRALPIVPDVHVQQQQRQSVDGAVRSAIEEAVATLGARLAH